MGDHLENELITNSSIFELLVKVAAAAALLTMTPAMGADLGAKKPTPVPVVAAFSWTGAYVGADVGYSFGRSNYTAFGLGVGFGRPEPSGFSIGEHAGYRYQLQNDIVLGAEIRGFVNVDTEDAQQVAPFNNLAILENRWGGDARLSVGYAFGRLMPYIAGGFAWSDIKGCVTTGLAGTPCSPNSFSDTRLGWTVGGGIAYAVTNNLIARTDYAYSNFGTDDSGSVLVGVSRVRFNTHAVRAGLSYKF